MRKRTIVLTGVVLMLAAQAYASEIAVAVSNAAKSAEASGMDVLWEYTSPTEGVLIWRNPSTAKGAVVRFFYDGRVLMFEPTYYDVLDDATLARVMTAYRLKEQLWNPASTLAAGEKWWRKQTGYYGKRRMELLDVWKDTERVKMITEGMSEKELEKWLKRVWKESFGRYDPAWRPDKKGWVGQFLGMSPDERAKKLVTYKTPTQPPSYVRIVWPKDWDESEIKSRKAEWWQNYVEARVELIKGYTEGMIKEELEVWLYKVYEVSYVSKDAMAPDDVPKKVKALMKMSPDRRNKALAEECWIQIPIPDISEENDVQGSYR